MPEQTFSWVQAFETGALTETQLEVLEAVVDTGDADSLLDAARLLDFEATQDDDGEPRAR